jgi:2-oxoglutarate dehydrogenase E1 component
MDKYSYLSNATPEYLENLYKDFKSKPGSVDIEFQKFFEGFDFATLNYNGKSAGVSADEFKVFNLINSFRDKGHLKAFTNPIRPRKDRFPNLELSDFGLTEKDFDTKFSIGAEIGLPNATLRDIWDRLHKIYCGTIGFEYGYVRVKEEMDFFRDKIEKSDVQYKYGVEKKEHILRKLNKAVVFEKFLGTKYIGQKRFSLEGGESAISALDAIIHTAAKSGVEEIVIGMAHRGRLNILANIMGKTYEEIFNEFQGTALYDLSLGDGDVKYHLGYSHQYPTESGKSVYLKLIPNPSHLEAVNPVVEGFVRAKSDAIYNSNYDRIMPVLVHGDAAVAGQGIIYEVLQMAKLPGYCTGGTLHFIINNQIGFTTDFEDGRSSDYCSSIAATIESPVLHVNGDDVEAVVYACEIATEYRQKFGKDVFIDMVCYRKWGHNESDEPKFTQPIMYKLIDAHTNVRDLYIKKLESEAAITDEMAKRLEKEFWADLQSKLDAVKENPLPYQPQPTELAWQKLRSAVPADFLQSPITAISAENTQKLVNAMCTIPADLTPLRQVQKHIDDRREKLMTNKIVDWAAAELMAYGSILLDGKNVRLSGEDVKRGTFTHRHAIVTDVNTEKEYNRLSPVENHSHFFIYNSNLSEYGVLGFEYGYSITQPDALVLWEAQYGDFSNGAQIITDQFIASGETKWQRTSGLVMLLPHGYEGEGPEHSSARLERYLQLCAELNMVVVNITDPANYFHALRRQLAWEFRKPLIVMSPKSLLRLPKCISALENLTKGGFREVIDDTIFSDIKKAKEVRRVVLCSGKIYYELLDKQEKDGVKDVAIVRLEQLYPVPEAQLLGLKKKYAKAELVWVQEEPKNNGAWTFLLGRLYEKLPMRVIARKNSASPATGFKKQHVKEQDEILAKAFE